MSVYQPFLIANYRVGLERDLQPWLLPNDAFPNLSNAYEYQGIIFKKGGDELLGRLGTRTEFLANRAGSPQTYAGTATYIPIEPDSVSITDGITTFKDDGLGNLNVIMGSGTPGTINYTTGVYANVTFTALNNGATVTLNYISKVGNNSPVMGLCTFEVPSQDNHEDLIAFDMVYSYFWDKSLSKFDLIPFYKGTTNPVTWSGTNYQFFASTNYQNAFFATNDVPGGHFYSITALVTGVTTQVTTSVANNFQVNDLVYINNATVASPDHLNGKNGLVTIAGNPFTVAIDSSGSGAYTPNTGIAWEETKTAVAAGTGGDGIRWFDGFTAGPNPTTGWVNFNPPLDGSATPNLLLGALLIFPYKDTLVVLNTYEGTSLGTAKHFPQRARFSSVGSVFFDQFPQNFPGGANPQAWYTGPGQGGFIDCPTSEEIIGAEFIKDTLVVYFERSCYRFAYTGNPTFPFVWEKINTEIGSNSTFSVIPFDKEILSVGQNGIYACDSINIARIDQLIPIEVFSIQNASNGQARVFGIRDYYSQFAYWTYPLFEDEGTFPNRSFAYNYEDGVFSIFENYYTCFGYYQNDFNLTWGAATRPWSEYNIPWNSQSTQSEFPVVVAGNQQGFVFIVQNVDAQQKQNGNAPSLVIQNVTTATPAVITVPNHNLDKNSYVFIQDVHGTTDINDEVYNVLPVTSDTFQLIKSDGTFYGTALVYTFGGTVTVVNNFQITTKKFNPFINLGKKSRIGYVDLFMQTTSDGQVTVNIYLDEDNSEPALSQTLETSDAVNINNDKTWHRVYINLVAQTLQIELVYSTTQVTGQIWNEDNSDEDVQLHGMVLWMCTSGRFIQ